MYGTTTSAGPAQDSKAGQPLVAPQPSPCSPLIGPTPCSLDASFGLRAWILADFLSFKSGSAGAFHARSGGCECLCGFRLRFLVHTHFIYFGLAEIEFIGGVGAGRVIFGPDDAVWSIFGLALPLCCLRFLLLNHQLAFSGVPPPRLNQRLKMERGCARPVSPTSGTVSWSRGKPA